MPYLDGPWSKANALAQLNDPPVAPSTFTDGPWSKVVATLTNPPIITPPETGLVDGPWSKVLATLVDPAPSDGHFDGPWSAPVRAVVGVVVDSFEPIIGVEPGTRVEVSAYIASNQPLLRPKLESAGEEPRAIVTAGSSTTLGQGASTPDKDFVGLLIKALQSAYPSGLGTESTVQRSIDALFTLRTQAGIHGYNLGHGGRTTADFFTATERTRVQELNPVAIVITITANDYQQGVPPATAKANLAAVLADLRVKCPNALLILVHSYQRLDVITPAYPWAQYGQALRELAQASPADTIFISTYEEFAERGVPGTDPLDLVGPDAIHATDRGYQLIADTILAELEGLAPVDEWLFTQTSGPTAEVVVIDNDVTFIAPSVLPPNGATLTFNVQARKGTITSTAQSLSVAVRPQTVWQGGIGTLKGVRPPVPATRQLT